MPYQDGHWLAAVHTNGNFVAWWPGLPTGRPGHQHHDLISRSVIFSWHWANQSLPYPNYTKHQARKQQVSIGLTRPITEMPISHTWGPLSTHWGHHVRWGLVQVMSVRNEVNAGTRLVISEHDIWSTEHSHCLMRVQGVWSLSTTETCFTPRTPVLANVVKRWLARDNPGDSLLWCIN